MQPIFATLIALALALPGAACAQAGWIDREGNRLPQTESMRTVQEFSGRLLITADGDWQEKWDTPAEHTPTFTAAEEVSSGGTLTMLTFLANPKVGADGMTDVACDFLMLRPDGTASTGAKDLPCFKVKLEGSPAHTYLTTTNLQFVAEPGDPPGRWTLRVTLKDRLRGVEVPLSASFVLK